MILVDTSAWVEFDRGSGSRVDRRLTRLISSGAEIAYTEPVLAEVLAGARDDRRESDLRRLLTRCRLLPFEVPTDFDGAVFVYRQCRRAGITPRGLLDCMITAVGLRHGTPILSQDVDLARVSAVVGVVLDRASLRP